MRGRGKPPRADMTSWGGNRGGAVAVKRGVPAVPLPSRGALLCSSAKPHSPMGVDFGVARSRFGGFRGVGRLLGLLGRVGCVGLRLCFYLFCFGGLWGRAGVASLESRLRPALWSAVLGKS